MNLRLCAFWFLYMAGLGVFFPFYSLYLRQNVGLGGSRVGLVMAMLPLVGMVTQPIWGQVADRTGSRRATLGLSILGVGLANLGLLLVDGFGSALVATACLALFSTAVLPMATAVTLAAQSRHGGSAFGFVRMWGTLGFLTSVIVFPRILPRLELIETVPWRDLAWMFPTTALFSLAAVFLALLLPPTPAMMLRSRTGDTRRLLRHPPIWRLLVFLFFAHLCLQGPINIFPLLIDHHGGDVASIGDMWILMLLLEIPLIGFSGPTLRRLGARGLLCLGLLAEGVRWTTCALATDLETIRMVQLLHGVGVAGVIIGGPLYLELAVPGRSRSTGQTLITTVGFGLGAILSISGAGWLFEHAGASVPYGAAGLGALILATLVFRVLPDPWRPEEAEEETALQPSTGQR